MSPQAFRTFWAVVTLALENTTEYAAWSGIDQPGTPIEEELAAIHTTLPAIKEQPDQYPRLGDLSVRIMSVHDAANAAQGQAADWY